MDYLTTTLSVVIFRIVTLLVGFGMGWLGYRLFNKGLFADSGDVAIAWDKKAVAFRRCAPGTFYAICGAFIVVTSSCKPLTFEFAQTKAKPVAVLPENSGSSAAPKLDPLAVAVAQNERRLAFQTILKLLQIAQGAEAEISEKERKQLEAWIEEQTEWTIHAHEDTADSNQKAS